MSTTTSVLDVASDRLNNHMAFLFTDGLIEIFTLGSKSTMKIDSKQYSQIQLNISGGSKRLKERLLYMG